MTGWIRPEAPTSMPTPLVRPQLVPSESSPQPPIMPYQQRMPQIPMHHPNNIPNIANYLEYHRLQAQQEAYARMGSMNQNFRPQYYPNLM